MAENSNFFALIVFPLQLEKLKIPDEVISKNGNHLQLHGCVELRVPNGEIWTVELKKRDEKIWVEKGWKKFTEHYSVDLGYVLVFEFDYRRFCFHVMIFGRSTTEIDYGSRSVGGSTNDVRGVDIIDVTEDDSDDGDEMLDEEEDYCAKNEHEIYTDAETIGRTRRYSCRQNQKEKLEYFVGKASNSRKMTLLRRAKAVFKSSKPHFFIYISPHCVNRGKCPFLPLSHTREYFNYNKKKVSLLTTTKDGKTRTWTVKYNLHPDVRSPRVRFLSAWNDFVNDNSVRAEDVCVFELINQAEQSYRVTVLHSEDLYG